MARGPLFDPNYKPQFSGHDTFPMRYGWLKKAYDRVKATESEKDNRRICWDDDAIARFGVGKNMVASMRHWAKTTGIIEEPAGTNRVHTTQLGDRLFGENGLDPFIEHPETLWLLHVQLTVSAQKTTWFWAFSHFPATSFERDVFIRSLERLAADRRWPRVSHSTVKNDVACFVRTYAPHPSAGKTGHDDALESPLTELGIIKSVGKRDGYRFVRGPKATLGNGVFLYALLRFWAAHSSASTLSFESIAHAPGAPGRIFSMNENDVVDRLSDLEDFTDGALRWSETAGLKQVVRTTDISMESLLNYLSLDYRSTTEKEAA